MKNQGPDPKDIFPNPTIPSVCFIKNVVKNPNIIVGDYTYYDDKDGATDLSETSLSSASFAPSRRAWNSL